LAPLACAIGIIAVLVSSSLAAAPDTTASMQCLEAAAVAEWRWGLPEGILAAIGEVETGQPDSTTGVRQPWPWSLNVAGSDYVLRSAAEAAAVVGFLLGRGLVSIDVGCFQVNLRYHPAVFASVAEAFDPSANGNYAGRLLRSLYEASGSWVSAIAEYHSANPSEGIPYRMRVLRAWFSRRAPASGLGEGRPASSAVTATGRDAGIPVYTPRTLPAALRALLFPALGLAASP
jgi:hypothetical protein